MGDVGVSVVIPHFEAAHSLERALDSVAQQTRRPAEVFVVDDASSAPARAATERVVARFRGLPCRLEVLPTNGGPGAARNRGWELATQPLVAFLDADDWWLPEKIERQSSVVLSSGLDAISHPMICLGSRTETAVSDPGEDAAWTRLGTRQWLTRNRFSTSGVMVRREVDERFRAGMRFSEDYDLWLRIAFGGWATGVMHESLGVRPDLPYRGTGLSSNLRAMEAGEIKALLALRRSGLIRLPTAGAAIGLSLAKFAVRIARSHRGRRSR